MTMPTVLSHMTLFLRTLLGASLLLSLFTFASCNKVDDEGNPVYQCDDGDFGSATNSGLGFLFRDPEDPERLPLDLIDYPCFRDSISVFTENGEPAADFVLTNGGRVGFQVIASEEDHTDAYINDQIKEFYFYVNYRHVDTFRFEYMFLETDCNYVVFDYARVYYNSELIIDKQHDTRFGNPAIFIDSLRYNPCPN